MVKTRATDKQPDGVFIIERMETEGLNNKLIAEKMDTSDVNVSRLLTGKRGLDLGWLQAFAAALNVHVSELFLHPQRDMGRKASDEEILALLRRVPGLDDRGVELAFTVISNHLSVSRSPKPSSSSVDDQSGTPSPRRGSSSSQ
ncbi:hypothetical protein GR158_12165 [Shinella sp. AETb1-6]|uniref:helix-turn-helix domain-containing protein n=1 Tax=Shinella sp. AETb1-6 TaxID=2692210 RepID=UPI00136DACA1|nr:helix-turn-helix transcriptional regulator [Shinella sp. AETb1-6]MXN51877.1 hypothetical protein [Shinella sp. AETb1-6]